jgi:hypothetical protein
MVATMILICTLNYEGYNLPVEQLKHDIGEFSADYNYNLHAYYEWQHGLFLCEMPDHMAFQFALRYPEHRDRFIAEHKFREQYKDVLEFELQDIQQ